MPPYDIIIMCQMIHSCHFRKPEDSNQADDRDTSLHVEEKVQSQTENTLSRSCDKDDNKRYFLFCFV